MGNCSLQAAADSARRLNEEEVAIGNASSPGNSFRMKRMTTKGGSGVWKVKLVIDPKELEMILSEEVNTDAMIQHIRTAANSTPIRGKRSFSGFNHKLDC